MLEKLRTKPALYSLAVLTLILMFFWLILPWALIFKLLLSLTLYIFAIALFAPELGLLLFLFVRPILDFSTRSQLIEFSGLSLNFTSLYGLLFIILACFVIIKRWALFKKIPARNLLFFWLLFFFWLVLSLLWSLARSTSLVELARFFSFIVSYLLGLILIKTSHDLTRLVKVIIFSALIPLAVAAYQFINHSGLIEGEQNRLYGTFVHPNMLAFFIVFIITLTTFIWLNIKRTRVDRYVYLLLSLVLLTALLFTYTRGAYLILLALIFIVGLLKFRKFLYVSLLFLFLFYLVTPTLQDRVNSLFQSDPYSSISWRVDLWRDEISYIKQSPLKGYGSGLASTVIANNRDWRLGSTEPHNDFLRVALDSGLLGLTLYIFLLVSLLWNLKNNYFLTSAPRLKMLNLFILAFALALFALSAGDNILDDTALQWSFWVLVGALMAVSTSSKLSAKL